MGRRLKLTSELQDEICILVAKGCHINVACRSVGIARSTYYSWLSQGEAEEDAKEKAAAQAPERVTTKEAEALTGIPVATLRKAARAGEIKAKKQRGRWLLDRAGLLLWAEPEGSLYLQFLEAVRQAEAEAEAHLVEFWQEQAPKDWRAARDLLARRWPERWSERQRVDASIKADVDLQAQVEGTMTHEIEVTEDEARGSIERFGAFLLQEAAASEETRMALQDLLSDGQARSLEEITKVMDKDRQEVLQHLQHLGATKLTADRWALPWASGIDDDLDQAEQADTPAGGEPVVTLRPSPVPPSRGAIVAVKTEFAKRRDGDP